jgi:hypothetical protein
VSADYFNQYTKLYQALSGISTNATKARINKMVSNKLIQNFGVLTNPIIFGCEKECILWAKQLNNLRINFRLMYSRRNRRILFTIIFAVVVSLTAAMLVITTGVTLMLTPAFAQLSENPVSCADAIANFLHETEGNITGSVKQNASCIDENENPMSIQHFAPGENMSESVMKYADPNGIPTIEIPSPSTVPGGGTTTGGGGDFTEFMDCLNAAGLRHPQDVIPTAEDVTSCYNRIYGSGAGVHGLP